ncbi:MAG: DNA gyrase subunit A, partial [Clostridia bacterium]
MPKKVKEIEYNSIMYDTVFEDVMHNSMLPYSESVILDRALPRVEDGLKPVQRRILYAMHEAGLTPDKAYKKCAKIVGDCLGKYHPHGDSSVYGALVRMAQPFSLRMTLVDGHGNFGSVDGDGAAAYRYTEARLSKLALELLRDLDKETVTWSANFDDSLEEPNMLPGRFPNLLVNGASGIAVGLATNIPTHNMGESIDAVVAAIDNPDITTKELLKVFKGPDFPTGGFIIPVDSMESIYETGKGKIKIRSRMHIEDEDNGKKNIVITEIPFQVSKSDLLIKIADIRDANRDILSGISDIVDESDKNGMRAVIKCRKDADINAIIAFLYKKSNLEIGYSINIVAIAGGKPEQMGLKAILKYYINYQREVVVRRANYDLRAARARADIVAGLLIAIRNIDEVIKIIKESESTSKAKTALRERFDLND